MIQGRDGARLALDAVCETLGGNLDRHIAVRAGVARLVHLAHAAGADQLQDFIRATRIPQERGTFGFYRALMLR